MEWIVSQIFGKGFTGIERKYKDFLRLRQSQSQFNMLKVIYFGFIRCFFMILDVF